MDYDEDKIDELILALLGALEFDDGRVWKRLDFGAMDRLHARNLITDPKRKAESVFLTEAGMVQARHLLPGFSPSNEEIVPDAYVIVEMQISDPEQYKLYMAEAPATVKAAGGEYLVRGGRCEVLEGEWQPGRLAMLRFASVEAARAWYDGERYRAARSLRSGATSTFDMVVVEGVPAPV